MTEPNDPPSPPPGPFRDGHPRPDPVRPWWLWAALVGSGVASFLAVFFATRPSVKPPPARSITLDAPPGSSPTLPRLPFGAPPTDSAGPSDPPGGRAHLARCSTNLRRVAAGLQAWANGHDWRLPDRLEDLPAAGLLDAAALSCPAGAPAGAPSSASGAASAAATNPSGPPTYVYLGKGLSTPVDPDTVVAYEPPLHFGGAGMNVLFGDGSVRLLTGDDARRLLAAAGTGRLPLQWPKTPALMPAAGAG